MGRGYRFKPRREDDRWITYGNWLELQRGFTPLTQAQMAEAIGISTRQWIRYTQGGPVPRKRIPEIAKVLGVSVDRALVRAGHEPTGDGIDVEVYLRRIRDYVFEGNMKLALFHLYNFYYDVAEEKKRFKPEAAASTANNFVAAALAIEKIPGWLRRDFVNYIRLVDRGGSKLDFIAPTKTRKQVRAAIAEELLEAIREEFAPHSGYRKQQGGKS